MEKKLSYLEKLKNPKWQKKRLEIMKRDKFKCKLCGDDETTLNVHHLEYSGNPWDIDNSKLITLCEHCHNEVEYFKKEFSNFNIHDLNIYKTSKSSDLSSLIFISYKNVFAFRIYNKDGYSELGYILSHKIIVDIKSLMNKSLKYKGDI